MIEPPRDIEAYDFALPAELIAARPAVPRDAARLLRVADGLTDQRVHDLPDLLRPGDLLVVNDTRVLPARLAGRRGRARIEATLLKAVGPARWTALARPARRVRPGDGVVFSGDLSATVVGKGEGGEITLLFDRAGTALRAAIERAGTVPLPPYIPRTRGADARDRADYQTVFAAHDGAVAAPTAGLHFTDALLSALHERGIARATLTLHVGLGTFQPIRTPDIAAHRMAAERGRIGPAAAAAINRTRAAGGRVVAVGSTALRLIETAADAHGRVRPFDGETDLYIMPGYRFRATDLMLTNFHLPRSSLYVLVAAFAGLARIRAAYAHAIAAGYRFYSYGDCCLLAPDPAP